MEIFTILSVLRYVLNVLVATRRDSLEFELGWTTMLIGCAVITADLLFVFFMFNSVRVGKPVSFTKALIGFSKKQPILILYCLQTEGSIRTMLGVSYALYIVVELISNTVKVANHIRVQNMKAPIKLKDFAMEGVSSREEFAKIFPESKILGSPMLDCLEGQLPTCIAACNVLCDGEMVSVGGVVRVRDALVTCYHLASNETEIYVKKRNGGFATVPLYDDGRPLFKTLFEDVLVVRVPASLWADTGLTKAKIVAPVPQSMATCWSPCELKNSHGKLLVDQKCPSTLLYFGTTTFGFSGGIYTAGGAVVGLHTSGLKNGGVNYGVPLALVDLFLAPRIVKEGKIESDTAIWLVEQIRNGRVKHVGMHYDEDDNPEYYAYIGNKYHRMGSDAFDKVLEENPAYGDFLSGIEDDYLQNRRENDYVFDEIERNRKGGKRNRREIDYERKSPEAVKKEKDEEVLQQPAAAAAANREVVVANVEVEAPTRTPFTYEQLMAIMAVGQPRVNEGKNFDALDVMEPVYRNGIPLEFQKVNSVQATQALNEIRGTPQQMEIPRVMAEEALARTDKHVQLKQEVQRQKERREVLARSLQECMISLPTCPDPEALKTRYLSLQASITEVNNVLRQLNIQEETLKKLTPPEEAARKTEKNRKKRQQAKKAKAAKQIQLKLEQTSQPSSGYATATDSPRSLSPTTPEDPFLKVIESFAAQKAAAEIAH